MKSNLLRTFFEWALITSILMSVGFFAWYYIQSRAVRISKSNITNAEARYQSNHAVMGVLLTECQQYSQTNAELKKVLDSLRAPMPALTATPAKSAK
jgi:hypothetical protein